MTMRPLPQPATTAECYLAAAVDRLDQLIHAVAELNGRLGPSTRPPAASDDSEGATVRLLEPDRPAAAPQRVQEPDAPEPPRHGKGSSRDAWAAYADRLGIPYPLQAGQRDIIAAVDAAKQAAA